MMKKIPAFGSGCLKSRRCRSSSTARCTKNKRGSGGYREGMKAGAAKLLKRPEIKIWDIMPHIGGDMDDETAAVVEMEIKYEGYIKKEVERIRKVERMESSEIPDSLDYAGIPGLKNEAREKLKRVRPRTVGQAMRISGVDPSDVALLIVHLEAMREAECSRNIRYGSRKGAIT